MGLIANLLSLILTPFLIIAVAFIGVCVVDFIDNLGKK